MRPIEEFPEKKRKAGDSYRKFDQCFDGRVWELVPGRDFKGKASNFRSAISSYARGLGYRVRTSVVDGSVYVQAIHSPAAGLEAAGAVEAAGATEAESAESAEPAECPSSSDF